jgi:hypothetical protein
MCDRFDEAHFMTANPIETGEGKHFIHDCGSAVAVAAEAGSLV